MCNVATFAMAAAQFLLCFPYSSYVAKTLSTGAVMFASFVGLALPTTPYWKEMLGARIEESTASSLSCMALVLVRLTFAYSYPLDLNSIHRRIGILGMRCTPVDELALVTRYLQQTWLQAV